MGRIFKTDVMRADVQKAKKLAGHFKPSHRVGRNLHKGSKKISKGLFKRF